MDEDKRIKCGNQYASMDLYRNLTFKVQKGRGLGSRDPISKFWDPHDFWTNWAIRFKFGTDIEDDRPCVRFIKL